MASFRGCALRVLGLLWTSSTVRWGNELTNASIGGRIAESGTYRELVRRPDSRFRALMAAQLDALDGRRTKEEVEHMAGEEEDEGLGEDEKVGDGKEVVVEEQRR